MSCLCRITLCVETSNFTMEQRYDIYHSLLEVPRYWATPDPPVGFHQAEQAYNSIMYLVELHQVFFTVQGIK